jgi:hypothetical protein
MEFYKLTTEPRNISNQVTINGDNLIVDLYDPFVPNACHVVGNYSLSQIISEMSQDHGCIAVSYDRNTQKLTLVETTQLSFAEKSNPTKVYALSNNPINAPGTPSFILENRFNGTGYFYILTPYINCTINDLIFVFRDTTNPDIDITASFIVNGTIKNLEMLSPASLNGFLTNWLPITLTGPNTMTAGSKSTYTVNCPSGTTAYISSDIGVINRSKATNGQSFTLDTTGLSAGETVTIKLGYKFWSGVSSKTITLT